MAEDAHRHEKPSGKALVAAAKAVVLSAGEQWTPMRESVFEALSGFSKPASAYDIAEVVSREVGRRVPANSIYRILEIFVGNNVVQRVESANGFIVNVHPECRHDCILLICDQCGAVVHVDDDQVARTIRSAAQAEEFDAQRPVLEMRGLCRNCRTSH
ncbi:transcriptional repressor [Sphingomonas sp. PL-96]|uniref:Fur family transcriptional regulator n=1 Tax=Sphingomonas sp. PL-96 TaxID=2887201 RepID=UPI001E35E8C0|nr:transcriptional repressor [Sphingomonas sp. PL-96]MCC2977103.1 transcriptional repressor [Sphingomonas sp. PL-96]